MVAFAGLSDQVTVVVGAFHERLETTLKRKNVDVRGWLCYCCVALDCS